MKNIKNLIEVKNLIFGYDNIPVLKDINLNIFQNDYILIIGPNGGGKTSFLKLILGIVKPWRGSISYAKGVCGKIGYVPQYSHFNKNFPINVLDMVLTGFIDSKNFLKKYTKNQMEKAGQMLDKFDLYLKKKENINNLSGGQIQKLLIARALVADPVALLLDEPTASIDITSQSNIRDFLYKLNRKMAIVMVTHDLTPFAQNYKRIVCINKTLFCHGRGELNAHELDKVYGCPVDLIGHGIPHTILQEHKKQPN